ncbi:MAG: glutathione synthase [Pseudomonadota bacterium]
MPLSVAVQMDPIQSIDVKGDSTFAMMLEAQSRGHSLSVYAPNDLAMIDGEIYATVTPIKALRDEVGNHVDVGQTTRINLESVDVILMRQDPPFDMNYITATHLLERIADKKLVVNDPKSVRNAPEKLFVIDFADLMPPTLVTRSRSEIATFRAEHKNIVVKPLFGNGGAGVFLVKEDDVNLNSLLETFETLYPEPFMVQRFLPEVTEGDKRIILVNGEPVGAINRVPPAGEARSNLHVGGRAEPTELTEREKYICERIGPALRENGFIFVGIDVIGDYLTEINVTSPTGIREIKSFGGADIAALIWDCVESKIPNS